MAAAACRSVGSRWTTFRAPYGLESSKKLPARQLLLLAVVSIRPSASSDPCGSSRGITHSGGRRYGPGTWAPQRRSVAPVLAAGVGRSGQQRAPTVVIVESPTKAKKIQGFLGDQYKVLASFGHVRDLPNKPGSVRPEEDFALDWCLLPAARARVDEIAGAAAGSPLLLLATDPDREGEAISWHIEEELRRRGVLGRVGSVRRITFTEITKAAVTKAMAGGRQVSQDLVDAYLARRALDYLVGINMSRVLWRTVPGAKSAGRVQSVALRLLCEREADIERFSRTPYWSVVAMVQGPDPRAQPVAARLTQADGQRLGPMAISSGERAEELAERIRSSPMVVSRVVSRKLQRHPQAPFTTSTLQQEASRRLGFGAAKTMRVAQQLYEGAGTGEGLITYMRTDGVDMAAEALAEIRRANAAMFGKASVPEQPRQYKSRAKNAQEAHEAIRPTRPHAMPPSALPASLDPDQRALYELIWRRAAASQMTSAVYDVLTVEFSADGGSLTLKATGSALREAGFLRVYEDSREDEETEDATQQGRQAASAASGAAASEDEEAAVATGRDNQGEAAQQLVQLQVGCPMSASLVAPEQHWTRPPPRYTEASLVRALEERGIGRPSTYAPIMTLLRNRGYVDREGRSLVPSSLGRVVTAFLEHYFATYVNYDFTSGMEGQLDDIASGKAAWRQILAAFWSPFNATLTSMASIRNTAVFNVLDDALDHYLFPRPTTPHNQVQLHTPHEQPQQQQLLLPGAPNDARSAVIDVSASSTVATEPFAPAGGEAAAVAVAAAAPSVYDPRLCPKCGRGRLVLKPSRYGGFIGCSLYADEAVRCGYMRPLLPVVSAGPGWSSDSDADGDKSGGGGEGPPTVAANASERLLGHHPDTGEPVTVRLGPYGLYVQLGGLQEPQQAGPGAGAALEGAAAEPMAEAEAEAQETVGGTGKTGGKAKGKGKKAKAPTKPKPKRTAVPKAQGLTIQTITLDAALALLALPRSLGPHPDDGEPVMANTGPFGPYVAHGGITAALGRIATAQSVDLDTALKLLVAKKARQEAREAKGLPPVRRRSQAAPVAKTRAVPARSVGYRTYVNQRWQAIKTEDPQAVYRDAVKLISAEWRQLGIEEQLRLAAQGAAEKEATDGTAASDAADDEALAPAAVTVPSKTPKAKKAAAKSTKVAAKNRKTVGSGSRVVSAAAGRGSTAVAAPAGRQRKASASAAVLDPVSPPANPFMAFCKEQRPAIKEANPAASLGQISKLLGAAWRALSDEEKAAYR